jgi:hypothetical protein
VGVVTEDEGSKTARSLIELFSTLLRRSSLPQRTLTTIPFLIVDTFLELNSEEVVQDGRVTWPSVIPMKSPLTS